VVRKRPLSLQRRALIDGDRAIAWEAKTIPGVVVCAFITCVLRSRYIN